MLVWRDGGGACGDASLYCCFRRHHHRHTLASSTTSPRPLHPLQTLLSHACLICWRFRLYLPCSLTHVSPSSFHPSTPPLTHPPPPSPLPPPQPSPIQNRPGGPSASPWRNGRRSTKAESSGRWSRGPGVVTPARGIGPSSLCFIWLTAAKVRALAPKATSKGRRRKGM